TAWVTETRTFQAAMFAAIRADARSAALPVYGPSMGRPGNGSGVGDLSALLDVGNIHPYPGGKLPLANLAGQESQTRIISGGHPWVVTETGYHNAMASTS